MQRSLKLNFLFPDGAEELPHLNNGSVPTFVILCIGPFVFPDRKKSMIKKHDKDRCEHHQLELQLM
jgi:hypothetical protein